jgi:hypothetical protein
VESQSGVSEVQVEVIPQVTKTAAVSLSKLYRYRFTREGLLVIKAFLLC